MSKKNKVLLIGWDAADWKVIHELMDAGRMPTLNRMIETGVMGNMQTLSPVLSPMLWTSIATGKRPYKHGIYGFTEPIPGGKGVQPMTNVSRKCKAIWNIANQKDMRSVVIGWWPSHPAEPINGVMVSDYFHKAPKKPGEAWHLNEKTVHPPEKLEEYAEFRIHPLELLPEDILPFVPEGDQIDQSTDGRVASIMKMLAECTTIHSAATHALETEPWDFAAVYYDAIDHFSHGFMKYRAPQQSHIADHDFKMYQHVVSACYIYHDMMLKRLLELAGEDTTVMLVSDHGFHPDHLRPKDLPVEPAGPALEHRDYGIFVVSGPGIKHDHITHGANLLDVTPTILTAMGLPVADDMDGRPLLDIFESEPDVETIPSWEEISGEDGQHPDGMTMDSNDAKEALEQLIALGYIERPDDDTDTAVLHCTRELNYNLARSYMDADMYGEAMPLLRDLYLRHPLEYRYGIQLANCLRVLSRNDDLRRLVENMRQLWLVAAEVARVRIREIARIAKDRKHHWQTMKKLDDENNDPSLPKLARINPNGKPILFESNELHTIRKLRSVARGNPSTLDFFLASAATADQDHEAALQYLEKAKSTKSKNPGFQFQLGNVFLNLKRPSDAELTFLSGLKMDEYHPNCLMGLCRTNIELGKIDKALEFGSRAVGLKFHFPVAHYFLGKSRLISGDTSGAVKSLETAIDQNPNFEEAHELLGDIYDEVHSDTKLAAAHHAAAQRLASENVATLSESEPIELIEHTAELLDKELPKIQESENNADFLRCLSQAKPAPVLTPNGDSETRPEVVLVSGLPRSGTSMMMQMLRAGGVEPYTDNQRVADQSNPKGYFEADLVKQLAAKNNWLAQCDGKALKVVAPLVPYLPQNVKYKVVFMRRDLGEVIGSQTDMLARLGEKGGEIDDQQLGKVFRQQAYFAINLLLLHDNPVLRLAYEDVIENPLEFANKISDFLDVSLDTNAMANAVDPLLYRSKLRRKPKNAG